MKNFNMILWLCLIVCISAKIQAQTSQMPKWPMNGQEIDFITGTTYSIPSSLSTAQYASNGYYGNSNQRLFHIIDDVIMWGDGTLAGNLYINDQFFPYQMFPEMPIVPKYNICCGDGSYYVFYALKRDDIDTNTGETASVYTICYNEIDAEHQIIGSSQVIFGSEYGEVNSASLALAVTDFIPNTNTRRLYYSYYSETHGNNEIKFFNVTPTGITGPHSVGTPVHLVEASEMEISSDMSKLIYVRPKKFLEQYNVNDLTIVHLNPTTGYLNTSLGSSGYTYVDISTQSSSSDQYLGVEFDALEENIYVTKKGGGAYRYNLNLSTTNYVSGAGLINESQLELGRDGYVYGVADDGKLYRTNGSFFINSGLDIGSSGVITNSILSNSSTINVRTLPEQIDKYDYDSLFDASVECCYSTTESEAINSMPGVSHNPTTGDITITG